MSYAGPRVRQDRRHSVGLVSVDDYVRPDDQGEADCPRVPAARHIPLCEGPLKVGEVHAVGGTWLQMTVAR
jgi:hypothetical protein